MQKDYEYMKLETKALLKINSKVKDILLYAAYYGYIKNKQIKIQIWNYM